jgi:soluble lytic murein transglycosylase-like protein
MSPLGEGVYSRVVVPVLCMVPVLAVPFWSLTLDYCHDPEPAAPVEPEPPVDTAEYILHCERSAPENFDSLVEDAGRESGINPRVIALTVYRESRCKQDALGGSGEIGLGQINPRVWTKVLREQGLIEEAADLYDPLTNLRATAYVLSECLRYAKGNHQDALRRYNGSGIQAERYAAAQAAKYYMLWGETLWLR